MLPPDSEVAVVGVNDGTPFTADDVVRHELVSRIVRAYDKAAAEKAAKREAGR